MSFIMLIISLFSGFTPNSLQRYNIFLICANFSLGIFLYFRFCFCSFPCLARGVGRLPLRCPLSARGQFALASVASSVVPNDIRAYPLRRPARFGLNAGVRLLFTRDNIPHVDSSFSY